MNETSPKIIFWTNDGCPWAQRAQIVLKELALDYEKVEIDLDTPREEWYLKINPRGTVPALRYNDKIITESAIVAHFLGDAHPSHLWPASNSSPSAALFRARVNFLVDAYFTKVHPLWTGIVIEGSAAERERKADELVGMVGKEIEPLLEKGITGSGSFFGGSKELTMAEALVAPFLLRIYGFSDGEIFPASLPSKLDTQLPNFSRWAHACMSHPSVTFNWDAELILRRTKERMYKVRPGTMTTA